MESLKAQHALFFSVKKRINMEKKDIIREYMSEIGRRGGKVSRRVLNPEVAREMARRSAEIRSKKKLL